MCAANVYYSNKLLYAFADLEMAVKITYQRHITRSILYFDSHFRDFSAAAAAKTVEWGGLIFYKTTLYRYSIEKENRSLFIRSLACSYLDLSMLGPPYTIVNEIEVKEPQQQQRSSDEHTFTDFTFGSIMLHIGTM